MSISFSIARELLAAADEAQIQQAELIGLVLSSTVVLSAVPTATAAAWDRCTKLRVDGVGDKSTVVDDNAGLGAFVSVFINVAQRISASICVQLVAANVSATQPLRAVRLLTLFGVAVFFVFVESTAASGRAKKK